MDEKDPSLDLPPEVACTHKKWNVRSAAYQYLISHLKRLSPTSEEWAMYKSIMSKIALESSPLIREQALEVVFLYVRNCAQPGETLDIIDSLLDKIVLNSGPRSYETLMQIFMQFVENGSSDIVVEKLLKAALGVHTGKVPATCLDIITELLTEFGPKPFNVKYIFETLPQLKSKDDPESRSSMKNLCVELFKWLGPKAMKKIECILSSWEIKELMDNHEDSQNDERLRPKRFVRDTAGREDKDPYMGMAGSSSIDLLNAVSDAFFKKLQSHLWMERRDALLKLKKILENSSRLQEGNYEQLLTCLKKIIVEDQCVIVVGFAITCITSIAKKLQHNFSPYAPNFCRILLDKFVEKRQNITEQLREALDVLTGTTSFESLIKIINGSLASKNPTIRVEAIQLLTKLLSNSTQQTLGKSEFGVLYKSLADCLQHGQLIIREKSLVAFGVALEVAGEDVILPYLKSVDSTTLSKIKNYHNGRDLFAENYNKIKFRSVTRRETKTEDKPPNEQSCNTKTKEKGTKLEKTQVPFQIKAKPIIGKWRANKCSKNPRILSASDSETSLVKLPPIPEKQPSGDIEPDSAHTKSHNVFAENIQKDGNEKSNKNSDCHVLDENKGVFDVFMATNGGGTVRTSQAGKMKTNAKEKSTNQLLLIKENSQRPLEKKDSDPAENSADKIGNSSKREDGDKYQSKTSNSNMIQETNRANTLAIAKCEGYIVLEDVKRFLSHRDDANNVAHSPTTLGNLPLNFIRVLPTETIERESQTIFGIDIMSSGQLSQDQGCLDFTKDFGDISTQTQSITVEDKRTNTTRFKRFTRGTQWLGSTPIEMQTQTLPVVVKQVAAKPMNCDWSPAVWSAAKVESGSEVRQQHTHVHRRRNKKKPENLPSSVLLQKVEKKESKKKEIRKNVDVHKTISVGTEPQRRAHGTTSSSKKTVEINTISVTRTSPFEKNSFSILKASKTFKRHSKVRNRGVGTPCKRNVSDVIAIEQKPEKAKTALTKPLPENPSKICQTSNPVINKPTCEVIMQTSFTEMIPTKMEQNIDWISNQSESEERYIKLNKVQISNQQLVNNLTEITNKPMDLRVKQEHSKMSLISLSRSVAKKLRCSMIKKSELSENDSSGSIREGIAVISTSPKSNSQKKKSMKESSKTGLLTFSSIAKDDQNPLTTKNVRRVSSEPSDRLFDLLPQESERNKRPPKKTLHTLDLSGNTDSRQLDPHTKQMIVNELLRMCDISQATFDKMTRRKSSRPCLFTPRAILRRVSEMSSSNQNSPSSSEPNTNRELKTCVVI